MFISLSLCKMMFNFAIISLLSLSIVSLNSAMPSCPMDLDYVKTISWDSSACREETHPHHTDSTSAGGGKCCQTLLSLFGIALSQHLKQTSLFRFPDLPTSISCLSLLQSHLDSLSLPPNLTSACFDPRSFVNTTDSCAGIKTTHDWVKLLGQTTALDSGCRKDLADLASCDACVLAGFRVHSKLLSIDRNSTHSKNCFYYTILYAAGIVNELGPTSNGALTCILGLPMNFQIDSESQSLVHQALIYGSAGAGASVFAMACLFGLYFWWTSWSTDHNSNFGANFGGGSRRRRLRPKVGPIWFKIGDLEKATQNFSEENLIGRGQFGAVYRGILPDGSIVAVKKIVESEIQGNAEFCNEVEIISTLKHRNLVPLIGCCCCVRDGGCEERESERYIVYDYMPNGNLNDHLFLSLENQMKEKKPLTWPERKSIILDVAKAVAYLHHGVNPSIYHRDIKPTNILLDADMRARVADFGLARRSREGQSHLSTRVAGTHGYLAPEYALYGQLTDKSDVYSFGVAVLEVMCGRKALDFSSTGSPRSFLITDWAWSLVKAGNVERVFDASLLEDGTNPKRVMERFVLVGILCAHVMVALRPNILDALKMLEGDIEVPLIPDRPIYADGNMFDASLLTRSSRSLRSRVRLSSQDHMPRMRINSRN